MKKIVLFIFVVMSLLSCGNFGKTHLTDLDFRKDYELKYVYNKDGSVFTGTVWSGDDKTIKITAKSGVITSTTIYHHNGEIAAYITPHERSYYHEDGEQTDEDNLKFWHPNLVERLKAIEHEIHVIE